MELHLIPCIAIWKIKLFYMMYGFLMPLLYLINYRLANHCIRMVILCGGWEVKILQYGKSWGIKLGKKTLKIYKILSQAILLTIREQEKSLAWLKILNKDLEIFSMIKNV